MAKIRRAIIYVLIVVLLIAGFMYAGWSLNGYFSEKKVDMVVLCDDIHGIGQLATAEYLYTTTGKAENEPLISDWDITKSWEDFCYDGVIKAGYEFGEIEVGEIDAENKTVKVKLPEPIIISNELDQESFKSLNRENKFFNSLTGEDYNNAQLKIKESMQEKAIERGLFASAEQNAKVIIESTLRGIMGNDWIVDFGGL